MSEYVFDPAWERERDRLRGLESLIDGATTRHLASADDLSRFLTISAERSVHYATPCMATAWGRRPVT